MPYEHAMSGQVFVPRGLLPVFKHEIFVFVISRYYGECVRRDRGEGGILSLVECDRLPPSQGIPLECGIHWWGAASVVI